MDTEYNYSILETLNNENSQQYKEYLRNIADQFAAIQNMATCDVCLIQGINMKLTKLNRQHQYYSGQSVCDKCLYKLDKDKTNSLPLDTDFINGTMNPGIPPN